MKNAFVRGSSVRYVHIPPNELDPIVVQEACKKAIES